ncbi:myotubularin-related protein 7-like [Neolamprologus brichardi]|uniref:myotubularin-related protein 7-like n=1 Tax=Neolamprologus brichardi TaxID=32507 RepID=UPI0003EC27ED|nr:myotubularin-related protein 7-like [Neolamprologus brichardi]
MSKHVENVRLLDRSSGQRKASVGTLYLSATHAIFVENNPETRKETWVLHSMVSSVERPPTPSGGQLILRCKDFRIFQIFIPQERDCLDVHASLARLSRPEKYSELYCLSFNPNVNKEEREESWNFIDLAADYKRMGVPNNLWVATAANSEYRVCDTYPSELFVPKSATPAIIVGSSRFRSRGRFPALSYFHQDTLVRHTHVCIYILASNSWSPRGLFVPTRTVRRSSPATPRHRPQCFHRYNSSCPQATASTPLIIRFYSYLCHGGKGCAMCVCRLHERTHSVWPQLWKDRGEYTNPLYKAEQSQSQGVLRPNTSPYCFKMWKGLYNHAEKSTPPRQSPADFLSARREESQQLEEELTNHQERIAELTGKPITWEKIEVPRRKTSCLLHRHSGPDPPTLYREPIASLAQDSSHTLSSAPANQKTHTKEPALSLPLGPHAQLKSHDPDDLSTCSDLESGVADLSSRSSSGGDVGKDPDLE